MNSRAAAAVSVSFLAFLAVLAAGPRQGQAASAIMVDSQNGAYGFCAGASDPYAAMTCAQERCEAAGGRNCQVVEGCPQGGHGAVARDVGARLVGGSCGMASEAEARMEAMQRCARAGAANCQVAEVFVEAGPGAAQSAAMPQGTSQAAAPAAGGAGMATAQPARRSQAAQPPAPDAQPSQPVTRQEASPAPQAPAEAAAPPEVTTAPSAGQPTSPSATEAEERKQAVEGVVDSLKQRTEATTQQAYAPLTDDQQAVADKLIGVWSSRDCAEKFWRITKEGIGRYNVFVWYEDGQEDRTEFEVSFEENLMVLTWDTRLPNALEGKERGRRYVEKIGNIHEDAYVVIENNYKDFNRPWTVRRCTEKR